MLESTLRFAFNVWSLIHSKYFAYIFMKYFLVIAFKIVQDQVYPSVNELCLCYDVPVFMNVIEFISKMCWNGGLTGLF